MYAISNERIATKRGRHFLTDHAREVLTFNMMMENSKMLATLMTNSDLGKIIY